jgi:PAS domain S-box-containing protein
VAKLILRLERLTDPANGSTPVAHVVDLGDHSRADTQRSNGASTSPLARWIATVAAAHDACLVLDPDGRIASLSAAGAEVLGCGDRGVIGRRLLDVIELLDFDTGQAHPDYAARIAPLGVLCDAGLMRSLLRLRRADGTTMTVDASAAPLHDARGGIVGSVTFLAPLRG